MKLAGFDLDQVEREARAIADHRKHELRRGRKPPDDDTIRIPVALLIALVEKVNPKPSKGDFRLTTGGYVRPGTYCGSIAEPKPMGLPTFSNPCNISADEVTFTPSTAAFETTVDALHKCNLCFSLDNISPHPLIVDPQQGVITHQGRVVGKVPVDSTGTVNINSLTATCRMEHSMGHVVVEDVKVR